MLNLLKMKLVFVFSRLLVLFFFVFFLIFKTYQWIIRALAFMIVEVFF